MAKRPVGKKEIQFVITSGEGRSRIESFPIKQGTFIFGRAQGIELIIEDTFASKRHCAVKVTPAYVVLEDLGSRNGTSVNGHKVDSVELKSGDKVQIGKTIIEVRFPPLDKNLFEDDTSAFAFSDTGEFPAEEATKRDDQILVSHDEAIGGDTTKKDGFPPGHELLAQYGSGPKIEPSEESFSASYEEPDEDDEDYDEEEPYVPYFSLIKKVMEKRGDSGYSASRGSSAQRLEIIECVNGEVLRIDELGKGKKHKINLKDKSFRFVHYNKTAECRIILKEDFKGKVYTDGRQISISQAIADGIGVRGGRVRYTMRAGDIAEIDTGEKVYFIRFVDPPVLPKEPRNEVKRTYFINTVGSSIALHILIFIVFGFSTWINATTKKAVSKEEKDRFVKLDLKDLEKKPEPTPTPTVKSTPAPRPVVRKRVKVKSRPRRVIAKKRKTYRPIGVKRAKRVGGGSGARVNVQATGVLASLGGLTTNTPSSSNVMKAVSNLDAVRAPSGTKSNFSVSGLIGKSGSGDPRIVRVSGPSTGGRGTDKNFGAIGSLGGRKGRGVGGVVVGDVPDFDIGIKGSLTREQVRRVIEKYVGEISYCYEKALFDSPGLEGKLNMFWEIRGNGRVGQVRIKRATLKSTSVNRCVVSIIKKMRFPKPKGGGVVQVTFPFVFNAASF